MRRTLPGEGCQLSGLGCGGTVGPGRCGRHWSQFPHGLPGGLHVIENTSLKTFLPI